MKLNEFINDVQFLTESNIVNGGSTDIVIEDADGNEVDEIHSFENIYSHFMRRIMDARTSEPVVKWFNSNFKNWIKKGAKDHNDSMMDEAKFQQAFYVPVTEYIQMLMRSEPELVNQGKLSQDIILQSFPPYVHNSLQNATIFSGGRLFRLNKVLDAVQSLKDYLNTTVYVKQEPNETLMPNVFAVARLDTLQVPDAFRRSIAWHNYVKAQGEKVSYEQAVQIVSSLQPDKDYKVLDKIGKVTFVQILTANMASTEGIIMKHCVASYGHDIQTGKSVVYSARDENNVPVATMEIKGKKMVQLKGPHNSTVKPQYQNDIRKFIKKHRFTVTNNADVKKVGGLKIEGE